MFPLILRSIFQQRMRSALLALGLLVISAGVLLVTAASETTVITIDQDLTRYWRTTYDILVRPAGVRSPIEEKYGLVEANHLSGIAGGITVAQYEAIKAIPGVEVAAPIAMLGYPIEFIDASLVETLPPGAYMLEETSIVDNGVRLRENVHSTRYYVGWDVPTQLHRDDPKDTSLPLFSRPDRPPKASFSIAFLMAGIDPPQEAALVRLDQAILEGEYLTGNEPPHSLQGPHPLFGNPITIYEIPVLINTTPYVTLTLRVELKRLALPPQVASFEAVRTRGGQPFLASLPVESTVAIMQMDGQTLYRRVVEGLLEDDPSIPRTVNQFAAIMPGRLNYQEVRPPLSHEVPVLEIAPATRPFLGFKVEEEAYREPDSGPEFKERFIVRVKGLFDIERIPKPVDVNRVPLETYFPPLATLRYDEEGRPVEPRTLHPTLNPAGYIQSPPLILTTLEAARALRGEACISAIRVCVDGIGQLTPAAQRKIEAIASEIHRRTGLTVDVMVGSSPRRVLVRVPGVGYVEEGWIQKGVNVSYARRVESGHLLLLATLLLIGGLYVLDLAWAEVVARQRTIALQKALGWRSRTVFAQVLGLFALIGISSAVTGAFLAWGLAAVLGWPLPSPTLLIGVPLLTGGLSLAGSLYPAWLATRLPPIPVMQMAGLRRAGWQPALRGLWAYAWCGLLRRWSRTLLSGLAAALSAALLVLLLAVTLERQGYLAGTLLGEYIVGHIAGYHYALVIMGFGLAALAVLNNLLASISERQREIRLLKAVGWRTGAIACLFVMEGALLGLLGGVGGVLLGLGAFLSLYQALAPGLAGIALLGVSVPTLVGALAALYPARVAARVPPAEAVRYE